MGRVCDLQKLIHVITDSANIPNQNGNVSGRGLLYLFVGDTASNEIAHG